MKIQVLEGDNKGTIGQVIGAYPLKDGLNYSVMVQNEKGPIFIVVKASDSIVIKEKAIA